MQARSGSTFTQTEDNVSESDSDLEEQVCGGVRGDGDPSGSSDDEAEQTLLHQDRNPFALLSDD